MRRRTFLGVGGIAGLGFLWAACGDGQAAERAGAAPSSRSPRYAMLIDLKKCVECQACTVSCALENAVPPGNFRTSVGEYAVRPQGAAHPYIAPLPRLCNHCEQPACLPVCPVRATYRHDNGIVVVDATKCIGCGFCVQACPYGARFLNRVTRTADKCTFCQHRVQAGLLPACVESCVGGARLFGDVNAPDSLIRREIEANKEAVKVLYPEKGTSPFVLYLHLNPAFVPASGVAAPLSSCPAGERGTHA